MKPPREKVRNRSISCSRLDWLRIAERAQEAGQPISRYVVARALSGTPAPKPSAAQPLVLDAEEQRRLLDGVLRMADLLSGAMVPAGTDRPGLPGAVGALFEAKLDEMARTGRYGEMRALLDRVLGEERAEGIADGVYARGRQERSPGPETAGGSG